MATSSSLQARRVIPEKLRTPRGPRRLLPSKPDLLPLQHYDDSLDSPKISNPSEPLMTSNQRFMLTEFERVGRWGLAEAIYVIASKYDKLPGSCGYVLLEDDKKNGTRYVWKLLLTLPDMILESLIKSTLPYDYYTGTDAELKTFVEEEMQLQSTPGIYLNLPNWGKAKGGKCLSARQMGEAVSSMGIYFDNRAGFERANQEIDGYFTGANPVIRQFGGSPRSSQVVKQWLLRIEGMYVSHVDEEDIDEPFTHCAAECGWHIDMRYRASAHTTNIETQYLFGVYNIITQKLGFPDPLQLTLFPIWEKNYNLCRIAEMVGHILCSTYWFEGGLNPYWAGEFEDNAVAASIIMFERNRSTLEQRIPRYRHLNNDRSKLQEFRNLVANDDPMAEERLEAAKREYEELRAEAERKNRLIDELIEMETQTREILHGTETDP